MQYYLTLVLAGIFSAVSGQNTTVGNYYVDPESVNTAIRGSWCASQTAACPLLCVQTAGNSVSTEVNTCDADTLSYACICSNGVSPNASEFTQTLPYFICTEWGNQCVADCGSKSSCSAACRENHPCSAQNPSRVNTTTILSTTSRTATKVTGMTTSRTATHSGTSSASASASASAPSASGGESSGASIVHGLTQACDLVVVITALLGGFAMVV